ncbi:hypothetical protein [Salmonella phage SSBI34]|nr:hypothetical protein [Salmonella phage SSBI34]
MLEILTAGEKEKRPVANPPICGYNFSSGSTSVLPTTVTPMTVGTLPDGTIPTLAGYDRVLRQGAVARVNTMTEVAKIGTGDFTFEHWIAATGNNGYGFNIRDASSNPVLVTARNASSVWTLYGLGFQSAGVTMNRPTGINQWSHVAYVRRDGRLYAFINGVPIALNAGSGFMSSLPCPYNLQLSVHTSGIHSGFWDFRWAEFAVSDFAKYDSQFTPSQPLY